MFKLVIKVLTAHAVWNSYFLSLSVKTRAEIEVGNSGTAVPELFPGDAALFAARITVSPEDPSQLEDPCSYKLVI